MSDILRLLGEVVPAQALEGAGDVDAYRVGGVAPEAVVTPASEEEVVRVLAAATGAGLGVVPAGNASGLGAQAPSRAFVALSTRRISGIEDYEPADLTVTARGGTPLAELTRVLAEQGQWLPADPPLAPCRTLGGLVASAAAGPLSMAYGGTRDQVLGLTAVTGDGRVLKLGGRVMKNVAGFDLVKLFVGSRGTLGVITSASLRLFPRPAVDRVYVVEGETPGALLDVARGVATASVVPASAVLLGPEALLVVRVQGAKGAVDHDARALLGPALDRARLLEGAEAGPFLDAARDGAVAGALVVRAFALPGLLPDVLAAVQSALPTAALAADVMAGRVRASVDEADLERVSTQDVLTLRERLEAVGGTLVLERAPEALSAEVPVRGDAGGAGALAAELRARFDPSGVLSPGRSA